LYIPRKEDQFITAVNTDGRFAVWSPNGSVVLLFVNPTIPPHEVAKHLKGPSPVPVGGFLTLPPRKRIGVPRMNATIFSKWFVRTPLRNLDAGTWPRYAAGLRLCFHHNLIDWGKGGGTCLHYSTVTAWNSPFVLGAVNKGWCPKDLDEQEGHLQHCAVRGALRPQAFKGKLLGSMRLEGTGPTLELLPGIRKEIARYYEMCVEKGTIRRTKNRVGVGTDGSHPEADVLEVLGDLGPDLLGSNALDDMSE
jgi:hypothetical protein